MTQPPSPPLHPLPYQPQPYNPRPTSVTVIAILAIIFGALGLVCSPFSFIPYFQGDPNNPFAEAARTHPLLWGWTLFGLVFALLLSILLLAGGIGALGLRPWARTALVWYSIAAIIVGLVGFAINLTVIFPRVRELAGDDPAVQMGLRMGSIGAVVGLLIGLALPIIILYFMTRPHVRQAFHEPGPA